MEKTFKSILSTKELTTRRKYDRRISTIKRRCSFAGSGNNLNVIRDRQDRRILPIELAAIDHYKLSLIDLTDLFMEAYFLFADGYKYSFRATDKPLLDKLYGDYIQVSDVDLILDEYLEHPSDSKDVYQITCLDLVSQLMARFPQFSKRINVPTIARQMNDRGFDKTRKGKKKITTYLISRNSKAAQMMSNDSLAMGSGKDSWEPWFQQATLPG